MCMVKTPRPVAATAATEKRLQVLRNPFLDGLDPLINARKSGSASLRINRGSAPTERRAGSISRAVPIPIGSGGFREAPQINSGGGAPSSAYSPSTGAYRPAQRVTSIQDF